MSVRRLAEDSVQPAGFAFKGDNVAWAERLIGRYPEGRQQSAVIPLLMRAQDQDGWVTKAAIEHIAVMLTMPLIRVLEVATFYTQFQLKPVGTRAHIQVCGTTPCMLRGSDDLKRVCKSKIHEEQFHLNASGTLSWEEVECLGACVNAPMVMVFKDTYEDLTAERLEEIIDQFERGEGDSIPVGPQNGRHLSAPIGGLTSLNSDNGASASPAPRSETAPSDRSTDGQGTSEPAGTVPSQAGRPTTHAPETDPSISAPGKASNGNTSQAAETTASIDPSAGADLPGAGQTGGTKDGPTGAAEKDAAGGDGSAVEPASDAAIETGPSGDEGGAPLPAGEKPSGLLEAPPGERDDLKLVRGVGPVLEAKLHELGVYHFSQIAAWTEAELVWIDNHLNFRGRAVRERWVEQARDLAARNGKPV